MLRVIGNGTAEGSSRFAGMSLPYAGSGEVKFVGTSIACPRFPPDGTSKGANAGFQPAVVALDHKRQRLRPLLPMD